MIVEWFLTMVFLIIIFIGGYFCNELDRRKNIRSIEKKERIMKLEKRVSALEDK